MDEATISVLCEKLLNGLMTHLRSIPLEIRIDHWLFTEHPEYVEMQRKAVERQLQENMKNADDKVRHMLPPPVYDACEVDPFV